MDITLNRRELLAAVRRAAAVAPADPPLDTLQGVLLEADSAAGCLVVTATNMEVAIEQKLPCTPRDNDALVINAELFAKIVEKLPEDIVELLREGRHPRLTIMSGVSRFELPLWERGSFPKVEIPFPEDTVRLSGLPAIARQTVFAAGSESRKPLLKCVNLMFTQDGLKAACSDGMCIVTARGDDASTGNISLLIPAHSLAKLARMSDNNTEYRVGVTGKSIVFLRENFAYSARLMEGIYIDADSLLSSVSNRFTVLTDVRELQHTLASVMAVTTVEPNQKVMLHFQGKSLTMRCDGTYGSSVNRTEVIPLNGVPEGEYWFLLRQFSACLRALEGTVILGVAQGGMLTLSTDKACYMQPGTRSSGAGTAAGKKKKAA